MADLDIDRKATAAAIRTRLGPCPKAIRGDGEHRFDPDCGEGRQCQDDAPDHPASVKGEYEWLVCLDCHTAWIELQEYSDLTGDDGDCGCDWPEGCGGLGTLHCDGCGGDQCVCACGGESECYGCEECDQGSDDVGGEEAIDG